MSHPVHAVVNRLRFAAPVGDDLIARFGEVVDMLRGSGCLGAEVVQVAPDELILVIRYPTLEVLEDVTARVGSPWMREHVVPLLAGPTERSVGVVVASFAEDGGGAAGSGG
jgi:hypothetical protein